MTARSYQLALVLALGIGCAAEPTLNTDTTALTTAPLSLQPSAAGAPADLNFSTQQQSSIQAAPIDWVCVTIRCNDPHPGTATCIERCNCPPGLDYTCNMAARIECNTWPSRKLRFCPK